MVNVTFDSTTAGSVHASMDPETGKLFRGTDIVCLEWMLDIGFLKDGIDSNYRRELPGKMIMQGFYGYGGITELGERNDNNWNTLKDKLNSGESVRIWFDDSPQALCGMFQVCTLLKDYDNPVYGMRAPKFSKDGNKYYLANGWASFNQRSLGNYIEEQRLMTAEEIRLYAEYWDRLVSENAPLRAVVSGYPISVEEDFYDSFLLKNLPDEPVREATVIEKTIHPARLGIHVSWLEYRIQKMIDGGYITVIKEHKEAMKRIIQRKQ